MASPNINTHAMDCAEDSDAVLVSPVLSSHDTSHPDPDPHREDGDDCGRQGAAANDAENPATSSTTPMSPDTAALTLQRVLRGRAVRSAAPLDSLRALAAVRDEISRISGAAHACAAALGAPGPVASWRNAVLVLGRIVDDSADWDMVTDGADGAPEHADRAEEAKEGSSVPFARQAVDWRTVEVALLRAEEELTRTLLRIDAVSPHGMDAVRAARKALVARAEAEIAAIEKIKLWTKKAAAVDEADRREAQAELEQAQQQQQQQQEQQQAELEQADQQQKQQQQQQQAELEAQAKLEIEQARLEKERALNKIKEAEDRAQRKISEARAHARMQQQQQQKLRLQQQQQHRLKQLRLQQQRLRQQQLQEQLQRQLEQQQWLNNNNNNCNIDDDNDEDRMSDSGESLASGSDDEVRNADAVCDCGRCGLRAQKPPQDAPSSSKAHTPARRRVSAADVQRALENPQQAAWLRGEISRRMQIAERERERRAQEEALVQLRRRQQQQQLEQQREFIRQQQALERELALRAKRQQAAELERARRAARYNAGGFLADLGGLSSPFWGYI